VPSRQTVARRRAKIPTQTTPGVAYSGLAVHAGLSREQADLLYDRGTTPQAWRPFADTAPVLYQLREANTPVAVVSNIGWDPRPVIRT